MSFINAIWPSFVFFSSLNILFQFPPIYYGDEAQIEKYSGSHVAVLMGAAFGLGFMCGVAIYFIVFSMCCLQAQAGAYSDYGSEHPFEDRKQAASSPTLSVHYV